MKTNSYFQSKSDALREARERRGRAAEENALVRIERSGYGGFVVKSIPVELELEMLTPDISVRSGGLSGMSRKYG